MALPAAVAGVVVQFDCPRLALVDVADVAVDHGHVRLEQVGHVRERLLRDDRAEPREAGRVRRQEGAVDLAAAQIDEVPGIVRHLEAVVEQVVRVAFADLWRDVLVAEQRLVPGVAAGLIGQEVGDRRVRRRGLPELHRLGIGAERALLGAVDGQPDIVGGFLVAEVVAAVGVESNT